MSEEKKKEYTSSMFSNCSFVDSVVVGIAEEGSTVSYGKPHEEKKGEPEPASKEAIIEYVKRLMPVVKEEYQSIYSEMWLGILEVKEVKLQVYNKGKQQGTTFNRDFVAQIIHQLGNRIYLPDANPVVMAEHLEPEKGKDHPVRQKLGESPDKSIKKAIEAFLKEQL